jgi:hypothetical protein
MRSESLTAVIVLAVAGFLVLLVMSRCRRHSKVGLPLSHRRQQLLIVFIIFVVLWFVWSVVRLNTAASYSRD